MQLNVHVHVHTCIVLNAVIGFILRVWVKCGQKEGEKEEEECAIVFERKLELFDLAYLGLMVGCRVDTRTHTHTHTVYLALSHCAASLSPVQVTKDGSSYPPNSVVVGMYEGLYSCPEVGGVSSTVDLLSCIFIIVLLLLKLCA